ncbi:Phosphofructokinase domain [Macleaya cordata]|uniref:Phosphofructokinase domain n=1 Tax=Macleaya cordata TaxID=56857 RepID=A0A200PM15_MACCD|nr:Phosphofructokinase domain [Macleaya cordata]
MAFTDITKTTFETTKPEKNHLQNHSAFSPINLQTLPHLTDYLPNLQSFTNPLDHNPFYHPSDGFYVSTSDVILRQIVYDLASSFPVTEPHFAYHRAGPRKEIFFDPSHVRAAIVTCGGLCPGLNTVIRELVIGLRELYGVREIFGVTAGYRGFYSMEPKPLDPKLVHDWHKRGGTVLETTRGGFDLKKIVDAIEDRGFNQNEYYSLGEREEMENRCGWEIGKQRVVLCLDD